MPKSELQMKAGGPVADDARKPRRCANKHALRRNARQQTCAAIDSYRIARTFPGLMPKVGAPARMASTTKLGARWP